MLTGSTWSGEVWVEIEVIVEREKVRGKTDILLPRLGIHWLGLGLNFRFRLRCLNLLGLL